MTYSTRTRDRFAAAVSVLTGMLVAGTVTGTGAAVAMVSHETDVAKRAKAAQTTPAPATVAEPMPSAVVTRTVTASPAAGSPVTQVAVTAKATATRKPAATTKPAAPKPAATKVAPVPATTSSGS